MLTSEKRSRNRIFGVIVLMVACWGMLFAQQVPVTLPALSVLPGTSVSIPIVVGSTTGANITAFEFVVTCDTTIITLDGIDATGTLSTGTWSLLSNNFAGGYGQGRMKVVAASYLPLTGSGVLVYIKGTTQNKPGSSPVQFESFIFNTGDTTKDPQPKITTGSVRVNRPPSLTPVSAKTVAQGDSLSFTPIATDPDLPNDTLTFTMSNAPAGAKIKASTGAFGWRPSYTQLGPFAVLIKVTDTGGLSDSTIVSITVTKTNVKPVITSRVPATVTTISYNKPTTFAVSATDPNGDPLTYKWVVNNQVVKTGPDTSYTTTFTDPNNTPKIITAVCTDPGGLADSTTWSFFITDVQAEKVVPTEFVLGQNYPNPFNPTTTIEFDVPKSSSVTLEVFNVIGARVRSLLRGESIGAGSHTTMWDGRDDSGHLVPSGVYMYRITAGDFTAWRKMTLLK